MSIKQTLRIGSTNLEETFALAANIASNLRGGEVFELISDLGGGKTAFVKGLADGLGSDDEVTSPSFTINNTYRTPKYTLQHFDFYRLQDAGIMKDELKEFLDDKSNIVVIEWGEIVHDILPPDRIRCSIEVTGENARDFLFEYDSSKAYLFSRTNI